MNLKIEQENQNIITDVLHILAQQDTFSCENILQLVNSHYHTEFSAVFRYEEEDLSYHMKDYAIQEASALNKFLPQMKTYGFFQPVGNAGTFSPGPHESRLQRRKCRPPPYSWISFGRNRCISKARWRFRCSSTTTSTVFSPLSARITTCAGQKNEISLYQLFAKVVALNIERIIIQKKLDREKQAHYARAGTQRSLLVGIRHRTRFLLQQRGSAQTLRLSDRTATAVRRTDVYRPRPFRRPGGHTQGLRKNQQRSGRRRAGPYPDTAPRRHLPLRMVRIPFHDPAQACQRPGELCDRHRNLHRQIQTKRVRTDPGQTGRRREQPAQIGISREHEPRNPDAAQCDSRFFGRTGQHGGRSRKAGST